MAWSESAYLDVVSPDGETGVVVRLARHTDEGVAWLWCHVFTPDAIWSYADSRLPCGPEHTDAERDLVTYELAGAPSVTLRREGPRSSPSVARVTAAVMAHRDAHAPEGGGGQVVGVEAEVTPFAAGSNLPGRSEAVGTARASLRTPDGRIEIEGFGQFHEQHQEAPRFTVPFTYATLRGPKACLVGLRGAERSTGFIWRSTAPHALPLGPGGAPTPPSSAGGGPPAPAAAVALSDFSIDPPADDRALRCTLLDSTTVEGRVAVTHSYSVPLHGARRPGTLVVGVIDGASVSGCVNDWEPHSASPR